MSKIDLETLNLKTFPILGIPLTKENSCTLDLSMSNSDAEFQQTNSVASLQAYIDRVLAINRVSIGVGGYREKRNLYQRFEHFNDNEEPRCHHLGLDIWTEAKTSIFLPYKGIIHSQTIIDLDGDYGGVIIMKHEEVGHNFYSLYGHLSHDSIGRYKDGAILESGELLATLGDHQENGGWPPHLHFQLIKNLGDYTNDYPGVCTESDKAFFFKNCPDPYLLIS